MNTNELSNTVAELQQQVLELRKLIDAQASEIEALRTHRAPATHQHAPVHLDREQRLAAVARLSAKHPNQRSFSPQEVAAEIACAE